MKFVFISNFLTHHQRPFVEEMNKLEGVSLLFIETGKMPEHRKALGYRDEASAYSVRYEEVRDAIHDVIQTCDVLITGGVYPEFIRIANQYQKTVYVFSERIFKDEGITVRHMLQQLKYCRFRSVLKKAYLFCCGAFVLADYRAAGLFKERAYQWGYFPAFQPHLPESLIARKNKREILWCGRFLSWKHYDDAIEAVFRLKNEGVDVSMTMIGVGEKLEHAEKLVSDYHLQDNVRFRGAMPPEKVREYMERAGIFLFTSDRWEGWGVVINEAMNSGCAVVASDAAGSVPLMISHENNGVIYPSGNIDAICIYIRRLLDSPREQARLGVNAYSTVAAQWNPQNAAYRLTALSRHILDGETMPKMFADGVCAEARLIKDGWFSAGD